MSRENLAQLGTINEYWKSNPQMPSIRKLSSSTVRAGLAKFQIHHSEPGACFGNGISMAAQYIYTGSPHCSDRDVLALTSTSKRIDITCTTSGPAICTAAVTCKDTATQHDIKDPSHHPSELCVLQSNDQQRTRAGTTYSSAIPLKN